MKFAVMTHVSPILQDTVGVVGKEEWLTAVGKLTLENGLTAFATVLVPILHLMARYLKDIFAAI